MRRLALWTCLVVPCLALFVVLGGCIPTDGGGGGGGGGTGNSIDVRSQPTGAQIVVDGADTGKTTPSTIGGLSTSQNGWRHTVGLHMPGHYSYGSVVTLYTASIRAAATVSGQLVPTSSEPGSLYVQTSPPGATILLDGDDTGLVTPADLTDVGPNRHALEVVLAGYDRRVETVDVVAGEEMPVELILSRAGRSAISGTVYDKVNGGLLVGATITLEGQARETATTLQGGYAFENVAKGYYDLSAVKDFAGGGRHVGRRANVYVDPSNGRMMAADILMAPAAQMGGATGRVVDSQGRGISNAYVYLDMGNAVYFTPVDEATGDYLFTDIPPTPAGKQYHLVASAPGFRNGATAVTVSASAELHIELRLLDGVTGVPAIPLTDWTQALTYANADQTYQGGILGLRRVLAEAAPAGPRRETQLAILAQLAEQRKSGAGTRAFPPAGNVIEVDVAWLANDEGNLAGYDVLRSERSGVGFRTISTLWDPNATFLADTSPDLGPDQTFYYEIRALNLDGERSPSSSALSVTPLPALDLLSPTPGVTAAAPVTFRWRRLSAAGFYGIAVFSEAPDYDTNHQGFLVWANTAIPSSQSSIAFGHGGNPLGAHLVSGRSYYAVLYSGDGDTPDASSALAYSPIVRFVAP